jgi:hypothetical protein
MWLEFETPSSFMSRFAAIPNKYAKYQLTQVQCPYYINPTLFELV